MIIRQGLQNLFIVMVAFLQLMNISAYTPYECGLNHITTSGAWATEGVTCAADHLPFGARVTVNGHTYIVQDRFDGGYTDRLDLFMESTAAAFQWGRQWITCQVEY